MSLSQLAEDYLGHLGASGYSPLTIRDRRSHLSRLLAHLETLGVMEAHELRREQIEDFVDMLCWQPTRAGLPMKVTTRNVRLRSVRSFTHWMYEHDLASHDAGARVASAREPVELPHNVLTEAQVFDLIAAPDAQTLRGFRDKAIIELLYATAIRVRELVSLDVGDVDTEAHVALIRHGKGKKDRVVPMGKRASSTVASYVAAIRSEIANDGEQALVVSYLGKRLSTAGVANLVRSHGRRAGLQTKVTPHSLRHACATHMMRRGAPIRHVQELLGHADIKTTQIYTRLTNQELMEAHARFHPREQDETP